MNKLKELFSLVGGRFPVEESTVAEQLRLAVLAAGGAVFFGALYGVAAGSTSVALAAGNVWKIPMVIILSSLCALPAGLMAAMIRGRSDNLSRLVLALSAGNFTGSLVLVATSPLIALYYHSTTFWGAPITMTAVAIALFAGMFSAWRLMLRGGKSVSVPYVVLATVQLMAMFQFVHIASPILPEDSVFSRGADSLVNR